LVSLTIENQKNGRKGDILSHHALRRGDTSCCEVKALVAQAGDLVRMQATGDTMICAFRDSVALPWQQVRSSQIVDAVKMQSGRCASLEKQDSKCQNSDRTPSGLGEPWLYTRTRNQHLKSNEWEDGPATRSWSIYTAN